MHGSRGCLGCCTKPQLIIVVDEPSKGLKIQGRTVKKPNISEDNWSRSKHEMDNSAVQSQRSISSMSTSNQKPDHGGSGSRSNPEFVNNDESEATSLLSLTRAWLHSSDPHPQIYVGAIYWLCGHGVLLWTQRRQQWVGDRKFLNQPIIREPKISCDTTYEYLLETSKPFPEPIPLPEMVDFLVDVWEQQGLYE